MNLEEFFEAEKVDNVLSKNALKDTHEDEGWKLIYDSMQDEDDEGWELVYDSMND